jgi:hypothetical protein
MSGICDFRDLYLTRRQLGRRVTNDLTISADSAHSSQTISSHPKSIFSCNRRDSRANQIIFLELRAGSATVITIAKLFGLVISNES